MTVLFWAVPSIALVGVCYLFYLVLRAGEEKARRQEDSAALEQLALLLARKQGLEEGSVRQSLRNGVADVIPTDLMTAELLYERILGVGTVRRTVAASFRDGSGRPATSKVETTANWTDLPADIRGEIIRTGHVVRRVMALPGREHQK